jgi:hypothetical protein
MADEGEYSWCSLATGYLPNYARRTIAGTRCLIDGAPTCCIIA